MARTRQLWVPVLAGLLVAGLLGVAGTGVAAVEPRTVTASIMVPAAAFIPTTDLSKYASNGRETTVGIGGGSFFAPLSFPVPVVNIKKITLYAFVNTPSDIICATLSRSRPSAGTTDWVGGVCAVDNTADPQTVYTTAISPRKVNTALHGSYLWVELSGPGVKFYGVKVNYSYTTP